MLIRSHSRIAAIPRFATALSALALLVGSFALYAQHSRATLIAHARMKVHHVVVVIQENRTVDNLFHDFPGADTVNYGIAHDGTRVKLEPVPLTARYDISNGFTDFDRSYDRGRMDGFDLRRIGAAPRPDVPLDAAQYPNYAYVPSSEVAPYWAMARQYTLGDHMFQSNIDQSFAGHLYLVAAHAGGAVNVPSERPWGCDSPGSSRVAILDRHSRRHRISSRVFPCFDFQTLPDELDRQHLSWRYYAPRVNPSRDWRRYAVNVEAQMKSLDFGQNWSALQAIAHVRYGADWDLRVISPPAQFLKDVQSGHLASVTWIVPDWKNSDHALSQSDTGPSWVSAVVNAVGKSEFWKDTTIFVVWDDSGGWYDHVRPPVVGYDGLGLRVPLLVVGPYAKRHYVSHTQYEFGSILRFIEEIFNLPQLAASDRRANDMLDCFDFNRPPAKFHFIRSPYSGTYFLRQRPSNAPPDTD